MILHDGGPYHIETSPLICSSAMKELRSGVDTGCFQYRYTDFGHTNLGVPKFNLNDTHREKLCSTKFSTRMTVWLLLTFFICLHNQLSSIYSIITY